MMWQRSYDGSPTLYLIATPIGNMEDMTARSIRVLSEVEVIFSEDTRVTRNLLSYFKIEKRLISLHDHNEDIVKEEVLGYLEQGYSVALVTDRGTPIISDPGYKSVKYVSDLGYHVVALPGACAFVPALIVSGIAPQPFTFYGFLDSKFEKKRHELENLKFVTNTIIFYEAPHRIVKTLELMLEIFGNRCISLSREISKKFESVYRGTLEDVLLRLDGEKGEFVIVVAGFDKEQKEQIQELSVVAQVQFYIDNGLATMEAIKLVARERNMKKNDVYAEYHRGDTV